MNAAFVEACQTLNISADDPSRAMVAQTIISLVEDGETDADQLAAAVVDEVPSQEWLELKVA
jgi:hypothetical protein